MEKESDRQVRHFLSQQLREKHEMIVVDPDGVVGLDYLDQRVSEGLIYFDILGPVVLVELGIRGKIVE